MNFPDIAFLSASETAQAIREQQFTPTDAVQAYLQRIDRLDHSLSAYITVLREEAIREAEEITNRLRNGEDLGPLMGVPIAVKDQYWTKGVLTCNGSNVYKDFVPKEDSTVIQRLRDAGSILLGKLNLSELAMGGTQHPAWGTPANPWDFDCSPGESSSGSGVAIASREAPIALGTDTGGSVRVPASLCGVTGLKPTYGLISRHGVTALSWSMDHVGIFGKSAKDVGIVLNYISGYDNRDPGSINYPSENYSLTSAINLDLNGIRIGIPKEYIWDIMDPEVKDLFNKSIDDIRYLGAEIVNISLPPLGLVNPAGSIVQTSEAASLHKDRILLNADQYDPAIRRRIESGFFIPATSYLQAQKVRKACMMEILGAMDNIDFLATPTTAVTAFPIE